MASAAVVDIEVTESRRPSGTRRQVLRQLRFVDGPEGALAAVEFEAPPAPSILYSFSAALSAHNVCIADTATRITPKSMFQRFQLTEMDGTPLVGDRRREVETIFYTTLD